MIVNSFFVEGICGSGFLLSRLENCVFFFPWFFFPKVSNGGWKQIDKEGLEQLLILLKTCALHDPTGGHCYPHLLQPKCF